MNTFFEIHPAQASILLRLAKLKIAKFSELNNLELPNDWFSFHIRSLKKKGLIQKTDDGLYALTNEGKTLSLNIDTENLTREQKQRISIEIMLEKDGKFLFQKRLKEPFYGYFEFPSEKVKWGENPIETATRCLLNECGVKANFSFLGINHKIDLSKDKTIVDDKYFLVCKAKYVSGDFKEKFQDGENMWLTKNEILNLPKIHFDIKNAFQIYESSNFDIVDIKDFAQDY